MTAPIKAILFDADGVVTLPEEFFSQVYAKSRGLDPEPFEAFFRDEFPPARVGKADLKELIAQHPELWQWDGDADGLLEMWFQTENVRNAPLLAAIQRVRDHGVPCYLATNQEKYRGIYFREKMFKSEFDGYFVSAELGFEKPSPAFFASVLSKLGAELPGIEPAQVLFWDDMEKNVAAAQAAGLCARRYMGVEAFEEELDTLSIPH